MDKQEGGSVDEYTGETASLTAWIGMQSSRYSAHLAATLLRAGRSTMTSSIARQVLKAYTVAILYLRIDTSSASSTTEAIDDLRLFYAIVSANGGDSPPQPLLL